MLYLDRIDISEGIDVNKTSATKECDICDYWYFLRFHDLLMMSMNLSNIAILNIKGSDYRCIVGLISKNEAINLMQNTDLTKKPNIIKHKNLLSHVKMGKEILTFGDIEIEKN